MSTISVQQHPSQIAEWIGVLPLGWTLSALKRQFRVINGATPRSSEAYYWDGDIPWATPEDLGGLTTETIMSTRRSITEAGYESCGTTLIPADSLVLSTRAPIGHVAIADMSLCTNQGCRALVARRPLSSRFYYYHLLAAKAELQSFGQGSTFLELSTVKLENVTICVPPLPEQHAIAAFLDRETATIDALIAKKQQLIELLREKRAALISHAVTRGLDPNASMKDSGVEWLGDIPRHWRTATLRRVIDHIEQGWSPVADDRAADDDEWAVIRLSAVSKGTFKEDEHKALQVAMTPQPRLEIRERDFLLTRANTPELVGDVALVGKVRSKLMMSDLVYRLTIDKRQLNPKFLLYWTLSGVGRQQITRDARGSSLSMVKVSQEHIRSWLVTLPPLSEQDEIVGYIDDKAAQIDALVAKVRQHIDRLRERRTALISAVVTGQIDVREEDTATSGGVDSLQF